MPALEDFPIAVTEDDTGTRLDQFLAARFGDISRSRWTRLIEAGAVRVDDRAAQPALRLKAGQSVSLAEGAELPSDEIEKPVPGEVRFRGVEPAVLFEDADLVVINKPAGLTVHPGNGVPLEETVAGWLLATRRVQDENPEGEFEEWEEDVLQQRRWGIVHRLDRGTSGALALARNPTAHARLAEQFAAREAGRLYWAVVHGDLAKLATERPAKLQEYLRKAPCPVALRTHGAGSEDYFISFASRLDRDPRERLRFRVSPGETGKRAVTHVAPVSAGAKLSLLECKLETGRTHQIRVHLSFLGLPILGDGLYGGRESPRMWLHAHNLKLKHPRTGEEMAFAAPLPRADADWLAGEGLAFGSKTHLWNALKSKSTPTDD